MPLPNKVWLFIYCWGFLLQYVLSFIIWRRIGRAGEWATSTWEQQAEETKQSIPLFQAVFDYPSERRNFSRSAKVNAQLLNVCDVNGLRDETITPFWSSWINCSVNENHIQNFMLLWVRLSGLQMPWKWMDTDFLLKILLIFICNNLRHKQL